MRLLPLSRSLFLALLFLVPMSCDEQDEPLSIAYETSYESIIGGTPDSGHPAVGVVQTDASICTGTLISPRIVVTAAHCKAYGYEPKWFVLGPNMYYPEKTMYVQKWIPHPQYGEQAIDGYYLGVHDIAIMVLTEDAPVTPMPYRTASLSGTEGSAITFVGYGKHSLYDDNSSGEKYKVNSTIGDVNSQGFWNFTSPSNPKNTCVGDSGGPAFLTNNGVTEIISVVSSGDENCTQNGWNIRIDIHASWIQGLINTYDPGGGVEPVCGNGTCELGETESNCPQDCTGSTEGGLGAACSSGSDCQDDLICVQSESGNFCTQFCSDPDNGTGCPAPYTCVPLVDPPPTGEGVCYNLGGSAVCGNGTCESGETSTSCPADCGGGGGCNGITYEGCCSGNTLQWCENNALESMDCSGNPSCGWDSSAGFYNCGTTGGSDPSGTYPLTCGGSTGPVCGDGTCEGSETSSNCPADCGAAGPVCGDGECEGTESSANCPADCGTAGPVCGDGSCEGTESYSNCPADCPAPVCGDGKCEAPETSESCPADCNVTTAVCGNGKCESGETNGSCPADCATSCGNGYCEQGETPTKCPADCNGSNPPVCGNGYCEVGETAGSCAADCGTAICGDGECEAPETSESCPADCDVSSGAVCGDGECEAPETSESCPDDCDLTTPVCGNGLCDEGEVCADCPEDCGFCFDLDGDGTNDSSCTVQPQPAPLAMLPLLLALWALALLRRRSRA